MEVDIRACVPLCDMPYINMSICNFPYSKNLLILKGTKVEAFFNVSVNVRRHNHQTKVLEGFEVHEVITRKPGSLRAAGLGGIENA